MSGIPEEWYGRESWLFVFREVRKCLPSDADAEDATQQGITNIKDNEKKGKYPPGKFPSETEFRWYWISASKRAGIRTAQRNGRYKPPDDCILEILTNIPVREDRTRLYELLAEALRQMSQEDRVLLTLRYFAGLPQQEISKLLQISVYAVRHNLQRALRRLHEFLDAMDDHLVLDQSVVDWFRKLLEAATSRLDNESMEDWFRKLSKAAEPPCMDERIE